MYENLSKNLCERMRDEKATGRFLKVGCPNDAAIRRNPNPHDEGTVWRPSFVHDTDKVINCPYYNRYADKTQVFSFFKNDDITRRALHVQLVSRIARTIGGALNLNVDLIEAIALGHDIGHTPFGHAGERYLDEIVFERCGRHFAHNINSVRVLDKIFPLNLSLQTLSGIAAHDGELELDKYRPQKNLTFEEFDKSIESCYKDKSNIKKLLPSTLEGCVVRISDIIAYIGKDRQDAERAKIIKVSEFEESAIGTINSEMINNLTVNIIENSYGKEYIKLDEEHFAALKKVKKDNYSLVYENSKTGATLSEVIRPMMREMFEKLLTQLNAGDKSSPVFRHHINFINSTYYKRQTPYGGAPEEIVADYIAGMTDDYFIDLYRYLFPKSKREIKYNGYFG